MTTLEAFALFIGSPLVAWALTRISLPRSQR